MNRRIRTSAVFIASKEGIVESIKMRQLVTEAGFSDLCHRLALPAPTGFLGSMIVNSSPLRWKVLYPEGNIDDLEAEVECL